MTVQFRRLVVVLAALLVVSAPAPGHAQGPTDVAEYLRTQTETHDVPGASYAVIEGGETVSGAVGSEPDGDELSVNSRMLWGSVSKPVTAAVAQLLVDQGRLDLDAAVASYLPGFAVDEQLATITVRQLLQHTSGLPFGAELLDVDDPERSATEVVTNGLPSLDLVDEPGAAYHYSSLGYLVVQAVIEQVTGAPMQEVVHQIFPAVTGFDDLSGGSRMMGGIAVGMDAPHDGAGLGYGYQGGDITALAQFAAWQLDPQNASVVHQTTEPGPDSGDGEHIGLGWRIADDGTIWHTGTVPGYFSAVFVVPDEDIAVVVLMNASGVLYEDTLYAIARGAFDLAQGDDPAVVPSGTAPALGIFAAALVGVGLLALAVRSVASRRAAIGWAVLAVIVAAGGWVGLPMFLGVPVRYIWLWVPDVGAVLVALPLVLTALAVRRAAATPRRTSQASAVV